jgi:hypothetical protein
MSVHNLALTYTGPAIPDDPWWIALEQLPITDDVATIAETAALLDAGYHIEACSDATKETSEVPSEDIVTAAESTFDLAICSLDHDGSVEIQLKVIRSHQGEPYRLHVAEGSVLSTEVVQEEIAQAVQVSNTTSVTLGYPVVAGLVARWQQNLVSASGSPPAIDQRGNTLYWEGEATGTIRATYLTTYDLVTVRVRGVDGAQGQATIRVVYHGLVEDMSPEMPDPSETDRSLCPATRWQVDTDPDEVTCYKAITVRQLCSCSGEEVDTFSRDQVVPCPDTGPTRCPGESSPCMHLLGSGSVDEYVDCEGDNGIPGRPDESYAVSDREYYKAKCCEYPSMELPQCPEKTESYKGGQPIAGGEARYRSLYGDNVRFVPVTPEGGTCGKHITRQVVDPEECCDQVPKLQWDAHNSKEDMVANDSGFVYVIDGLPPFTWVIAPAHGGLWFKASGTPTLVNEDRWAEIVSWSADVCGTYTVTVTDSCGTVVVGEIEGASGAWVVRMNGASEWWTMDEFLVETGAVIPITLYHRLWFEELDPEFFGGLYPITHAAKIYIDRGDNDVIYEQLIGVAEFQTIRDNGVISTEWICRAIADGPPESPADAGVPSSIPTDVWPSDPDVEFSNFNFVVEPDNSIWIDGYGPGGYDVDTRRTLLYDLPAYEEWSLRKTVDHGVYAPGYTLKYDGVSDDDMAWGYISTPGSGPGCCDDGENCYQGWFSYVVYRQYVRIYDLVCG